jgi:hypothetical protein
MTFQKGIPMRTLSKNTQLHPLSDLYINPIDHLIIICDVDGVIRHGADENIDPRIAKAFQKLATGYHADIVLISGTPIVHDSSLEEWRRANLTLDKAVGEPLKQEIQNQSLTLYGALGGQLMNPDGSVKILEQYSLETSFALAKLLLYAFLGEIETQHSNKNEHIAILKQQIKALKLQDPNQDPNATPREFAEIVHEIRSTFDPNFRLVHYGTFIESHTSNPPWTTDQSILWLQKELEQGDFTLNENERALATGVAHRGKEAFNFLMISKTHKGRAIKGYLENKLQQYPHACIITIGDTQVDFPMHQHAHHAYHVGSESVWANHPLPHFHLIQDLCGRDKQHVEGTLHILNQILKICRKSS